MSKIVSLEENFQDCHDEDTVQPGDSVQSRSRK
jgi:hypothetical protein